MHWTSIVSLLLLFVVASVRSEVKSYSNCLQPGTNAILFYYQEISKSGHLLQYQNETVRIPETGFTSQPISCITRLVNIDRKEIIADNLDALMITRKNARIAARLVESLTEMATTTVMFLEETSMPRDDVDNIVAAIQTTFRKSIDSEEIEESEETMVVSDILTDLQIGPDQAEVAAAIIQNAYRRFKERKEREKELLAGMVDWRVAARSAIRLYRKTGVSNEEANRAATLIKAAYKDFCYRFVTFITTVYKSNGRSVQYLKNSNMYKILALFVLVVVTSVRSDNYYINDCLYPGINATFLYSQEVSKSGHLLEYQSETIRIPEANFSPQPISCITIINLQSDEIGGYPYIKDGGVGFDYVILYFKSQLSLGYDFRVSVYYNDITTE